MHCPPEYATENIETILLNIGLSSHKIFLHITKVLPAMHFALTPPIATDYYTKPFDKQPLPTYM
jgi:hypothetical protein